MVRADRAAAYLPREYNDLPAFYISTISFGLDIEQLHTHNTKGPGFGKKHPGKLGRTLSVRRG